MSTDRRAPSMSQATDCSSARKRRNLGESSYPHGKRKQEQCLSIIEDAVDRKEGTSILSIIKELRKTYHIPIRTLYSWWNHVEQWGEYPFETRERKKQLQRLRGKIRLTRLVTSDVLDSLQEIIESHPEYYLDEIQFDLLQTKGVILSLKTIWRTLTEKLNYSMQVCYHSAAQRNEGQRRLYMQALDILVKSADQLVFIDETHKDKNASRRRKAWGKRNSGGIALRRWFTQTIRYTMIAALDINGFIPSSIELVRRDQISSEGAAGTVDSSHFESWVENHLCPVLGNYVNGEPRSIVVMDNASTHMHGRVEEMVRATGAILVYTAPFSPDLNPIELAFNIYKAHLKRNMDRYESNWFQTHLHALAEVNRDICINEYKRCKMPKCDDLLSSTDEQEIVAMLLSQELIYNKH